MQANTQRVCFPSEASHVAGTSASRFVASISLQKRAYTQRQRGCDPAPGAGGLQPQRGRNRTAGQAPLQQRAGRSGGVCGSRTGCRLNNPPFLKRVVPEGQGCLQWGGGVRGNCLRGCFHNARTVNKFSLLYSEFPRVSHQKRE